MTRFAAVSETRGRRFVSRGTRPCVARAVKFIAIMTKTIDHDQLDAVSGGFDLNSALAAGGFLSTGGKAVQNAMTADGLKLTLEHGRVIVALAGGIGAAGWVYGAGRNVGQQLGWISPDAPAAKGGGDQ
jgi:hypothetical protein